MAHEEAVLTFTLDDQFSDKFQEIVGKLEDFQRRMGEVSKRGKEGFQEVGENVKKIGDHSAGANASLRQMGTFMKDAFSSFNKELAASAENLGKFHGSLAGIGSGATSFVSALGPIGRVLGTVGTAAAGAAGSIYLLNRHLAAAYNETINLESRLGMSTKSIETVVQIFERMGKSREGALQFLNEWNKAIEDSFAGSGSRIYKALREGIQGEAGVQIANIFQETFEKIRAGIISKEDGIREALQRIGPQPEWARRVIAQTLHTTTDVIDRWIEESKNTIPPTIFSDQVLEAMKHLNREMADGFQRIRNAWTKGWNDLGPEGVKKNEEAMKHLNEQIAILAEKLPAAFTAGVQAAGALLTAVNKVVDAIKYVLEHIEGVYGKSPEEAARIREENRKAQEEEHKRRYHERKTTPTTPEDQAAAAAADAERARRAEVARKAGNIGLAESIEKYRREHPVQGTAQQFGAYGGADTGGLRINENLTKMLSDPALIAAGARHLERRDLGIPAIGDAMRSSQQLSKYGDPISQTQAGESLREIKENTTEIRDVLTWLRDQIVAGEPIPVQEMICKCAQGGPRGGDGDGKGGPFVDPRTGKTFGDGDGGRLKIPTSPAEAPETLEAARKGGFMPDGQGGALSGTLGQQRQQVLAQNPKLKQMLLAMAQGEVGGQGKQAVQAWLESTLNWGVAHPGQLAQHLQSSYYPPATRGRMRGGEQWAGILDQVLAGSTIAGPSTGNESKPLGITKSGGVVQRFGGETFGVEPDAGSRAFAAKFRGGGFPATGGGSGAGSGWTVGGIRQALSGGQGSDVSTPESGATGVPSAILAKAKQVAQLGGGPAVFQFMASMGHPKAGNWCGEFAASVVKAAGGTPPRNPEVASNWRHFGHQVATPMPGDIAVRRGTPTGSTGSHVTVVGAIDPGGGGFTAIGGNQGRMVSHYATGSYQFFRGGGGGDYAGAGQVPMTGGTSAHVQHARAGMSHPFHHAAHPHDRSGADINIHVTAPRGDRVSHSARGRGMLAHPKVKTSRTGQMRSAGQNARDEANPYGEE